MDTNDSTFKFYKHLVVLSSRGVVEMTSPSFENHPEHVIWAEELIQNIAPVHNKYADRPSYIQWAGINGADNYQSRTQSHTFLTHLLKHTYGWNDSIFRSWLGSSSPSAAMYHRAIQFQNGFALKPHVRDIAVGDVLAIKHPNGISGTGHMMLVRNVPKKITPKAPIITGTHQYAVDVYDSSEIGHGTGDTRNMPDGSWHSGVGAGTFRIYADASSNKIAGHTWGAYNKAIYHSQSEQHLLAGRCCKTA